MANTILTLSIITRELLLLWHNGPDKPLDKRVKFEVTTDALGVPLDEFSRTILRPALMAAYPSRAAMRDAMCEETYGGVTIRSIYYIDEHNITFLFHILEAKNVDESV